MSQRQWIVIIGVWVMVFLFAGLPSSIEKALAIVTGIAIIVLAYRIRFKEAAPKGAAFTDSHIAPAEESETAPADAPAAPLYQNDSPASEADAA